MNVVKTLFRLLLGASLLFAGISARLTRLFFQPVLVLWALWCTGAWQAWRSARRAS